MLWRNEQGHGYYELKEVESIHASSVALLPYVGGVCKQKHTYNTKNP